MRIKKLLYCITLSVRVERVDLIFVAIINPLRIAKGLHEFY